jgi:hypothetical protein
MKKIILYGILFFTVVLSGCDKDLDFEGFKSKPSLVVQGFISSDSFIKIRITQTVDIMSKAEDGPIVGDAIAELIDEAGNKFSLVYISNGYYTSTLMPAAGKAIQLSIQNTGFNNILATDSIPKSKPLITTDTSSGPLNRFEILVKLKDPLVERNYYLLEVLEKSRHYIKRPNNISVTDTIEGYFPVKFGASNNIFVSGSNIQEWIYDFEMFEDGIGFNGLNYQLNLTIEDNLLSKSLNKSKSEGLIVLVNLFRKPTLTIT